MYLPVTRGLSNYTQVLEHLLAYLDTVFQPIFPQTASNMGEPTAKEHADIPIGLSRGESINIGDVENTTSFATGNLFYNNVDEEPVIHLRTWIALASMFMMNFVQTFALQGPPSVVSKLPLFDDENVN